MNSPNEIMKLLIPFFTLVFSSLFISCVSEISEPADETTQMATRLDSIAQHADPWHNEYVNRLRVQQLKNIPVPFTPRERFTYTGTLALELINAGETREAIDLLERMLDGLETDRVNQQIFKENVLDLLALAWLRLGEQENCIINHSAESCLFPILGEGIHTLTEGSSKAIEYYTQLLTDWQPENLEYRWLLNIAYMTLGKYPNEVPEEWLIPAYHFDENQSFPRFQEIAPMVGLADEMTLSGGSITEDFNNNGLIDIIASSWGMADQLQFYENTGDGKFINKTDEAGLTGITGGLNLIHADYNNSGFSDVLVLRGAWFGKEGQHPNSLLRNNGDGTFTDVTESAGILSFHPTQTAVWADFNNNGWIDLFIGNESTPDNPHPSELYLNNQDGTFQNVALQAGAAVSEFVKGVTAGDINNNGYPDLYISVLGGSNILLRNNGPNDRGIPLFLNVTQQAGVAEPQLSFPVWFWDYNNNGWTDLLVFGYYATAADVAAEYLGLPTEAVMPRLYQNNGNETFTDVTEETGLNRVMYTMGTNFGDLDNDGYLDFYAGTGDPNLRALMPNRMFRNVNGARFEEVTASGGFGHLQKGHGVSFADLNNNGHQDIFTVIGGAFEGDIYQNALFENPGNSNNWITLHFDGEQSNRRGIGNRVSVTIQEADSVRTIHRTVTTGGSFGSSSLQLEIGLGNAEKIPELTVFWPASGTKQHYLDVAVNRFYRISEFADSPELVDRTSFRFNTSSDHHEH